jgi:hypothetical protein
MLQREIGSLKKFSKERDTPRKKHLGEMISQKRPESGQGPKGN